ncbi:cation efflux family-domain-containing protein [Chytriomyces cf. hyalinus JEL632]|nr:cation efflux family-domain-containing protein [Chytriomyces cf. hyalinus JEL632]
MLTCPCNIHEHTASSLARRHSRSTATFVSTEALLSAVKSEDEIKAVRKAYKGRKGRNLAKFYESQNERIEELLKPVDQEVDENEEANLVKLNIAMYGSLIANILLLGLQLFAAITSKSLALFATMADSFMDLASNSVLLFASVSAAKKNIQHFPAGKQRFETAGIVVFSSIMGALSVQLIIEGAKTLGSGDHATDLGVVNLSCIGVAVALKICLWAYCRLLSQYPTAKILAQDHRNDVLLNIAGIILSILGDKVKWWIDPLGGILIATYILVNWGETAVEHIQMFIGKSASPTFLSRVTYLAMTHHPEVLQVDTVRAYSSGAGYFVEVDLVMDSMTPLQKSHDIGEALQTKIEGLEGVERAFVHIDYETTHAPEHPC